MTGLVGLGRVLLGAGMVALGGMGIAFADFIMEWTQVPEHLPARAAFAYLHGAVLIVAGLAFILGKGVRPAALALGSVWLLWTLLCIPLVIATWRGRAGLEAELLGMTCGIFTLAALAGPTINRPLLFVCRYAFALCLPVYGMVHFLYPAAVASWVPKWLGVPMFWAYFTGTAHCAAGLALLTGVLARLATKLFAVMISLWVLILHIPRVATTPRDRHEWLTLFIALSLSGVAWIMAGSLKQVPEKKIF
jgi:uncharacterized membrane protein YphA (DoxX/SURF4 family)